jgi:hypothetical protein
MVADITTIAKRVDNLKMRHAERDGRMQQIQAVRKGNMSSVFPELFPEGMSQSMVANFIDVAARDLAEVLAPLPSFNCSTISISMPRLVPLLISAA